MGATDSLKGTGVWSFIEAERGAGAKKAAVKPASKSASKTPAKVRLPSSKGK